MINQHELICIQELEAVAREWTKPPPDALFGLRVPVEYASIHAAVSKLHFLSMIVIFNKPHSVWWLAPTYTWVQSLNVASVHLISFAKLTGEDSYQIAVMGVQGLRVEIVSDAPPPPDEPP